MIRMTVGRIAMAGALLLAAPAVGAAQGGRDQLTAEEIAKEPGLKTALQAVRQLRVQWLRARLYTTNSTGVQGPETTAPVAYINNQRQATLEDLERIDAREVAAMRFVPPTDAMTRYGRGHERGAILVELRKP